MTSPMLPQPSPRQHVGVAEIVRWVLFVAALLGLLLTTAPIAFR